VTCSCIVYWYNWYNLFGFIGINSSDLVAQWENGSSTDECLESLETNILFKCNPYAKWESDSGSEYGDASSYLMNFFVNFENPCGVSY